MRDLSWIDAFNNLGEEEKEIVYYFCEDTTDRIMKNYMRLGIGECKGSTGALYRSIHSTIYNNASGNDMLVRFYYMNYARFVELAVGRYFGVDKEGVKYTDVAPIPAFGSYDFGPIDTKAPKHRAKPFLHSAIHYQIKKTSERLAKACAYTASIYLIHGLCSSFDDLEEWTKQQGMIKSMQYDMGLGGLKTIGVRS